MSEDRAFSAGAALLELGEREGVLEVRGRDAADYLQRRLSADIRRVVLSGETGRGAPACLLTGKGKLIAPLRVLRLGAAPGSGASAGPGAPADGRFLLLVERPALAPLAEGLASLVILEEVEIAERDLAILSVQGPAADRVLHGESAGGEPLPAGPHEWVSLDVGAAERGIVLRAARSPAGGFDLILPAGRREAVRSRLVAEGALPVGEEAIERHRIAAGIPRFGVDATAENLPTECGYDDAIAYDKGCYAGQEVLARIRTYGHVNRRLCRLRLAGEGLPPIGAELRAAEEPDKSIGAITSAARDPGGEGGEGTGRAVALASVRHRHVRPGALLSIDGGGAATIDLVIGAPPPSP